MKNNNCRSALSFSLLTLLGWFALTMPAHGDVAVLITPSVISNNYNGYVTLQITGLNTGEQVRVDKYLDVNTNGVIDAGDSLVQRFKMTDGQASMIIGGVTNINMPYDSTSSNGVIVAPLLFFSSSLEQEAVGTYLYAISSPTGRFATVTNTLTVVNAITNQTITGSVQCGGTNVPYASVMLISPAAQGPIGVVVADGSGMYTIGVAPGMYQLWAIKSNYVFNTQTAPTVTVSPNTTVSTNLAMSPATQSISGQVVDSVITSKGLPGILVYANSDGNLFVTGFTDTNGNFNLPAAPDGWSIGTDESQLAFYGYLANKNGVPADTTTGSVSGVTIALPHATALFYGRVTDNTGNPLAGIEIQAQDNDNNYEANVYTDTNGNYVAGALGGGDQWQVQVDSDHAPSNYVFSQPDFDSNGGTNILANTAIQVNFTGTLAANTISGTLLDGTGSPIPNVDIWANNGGSDQDSETDGSGHYSINVNNGAWTVGISTGTGDGNLPGNYLPSDNQQVIINNSNVTVNFVALLANQTISGHVTLNGNPVTNVQVYANATINSSSFQVYADTDGGGNYLLNVANGDWSVGVNDNNNNNNDSLDFILGVGNYQAPASQDVNINSNNGTANFIVLPYNLQIITTTLPNGTNGVPYDQFLNGANSGGAPNWTLNGGSLPSNLTLDSDGEIHGTPGGTGTFNFNVQLTDGFPGHSTNQNLSIYIAPVVAPLQITTTFLPAGTNGAVYNAALQATGGLTPYNWSLASGALPPGLSLATTGTISGVCGGLGNYNFAVHVADAGSQATNQNLSINVAAASVSVQWAERAFLPSPLANHAAAVISGKVYVVGGYYPGSVSSGDLYAYDPSKGTWSKLAPMPTACNMPVAGAINGLLYVAGKFAGGFNMLMVYNPQANIWTNRAAPVVDHSLGASCGVIGNKLYVFGGTTVSSDSLDVYDSVADTWDSFDYTPMPTPRAQTATAVISNLLYVVGGYNTVTYSGDLTTMEIYNPQDDSWTTDPAMPHAREGLSAVAVNNQLYVMGGDSYSQSLDIFDPASQSWTSGQQMPTSRSYLAAVAASNTIFAIGGSSAGTVLPTLELCSPASPDTVRTFVFQSDTNTLSAGIASGAPSGPKLARLDAGGATGLTFQASMPGVTGGTYSAVMNMPAGAWQNAAIVTIAPGNGQNGFFTIPFVLPPSFGNAQLSLGANADFYARAFLNGNPFTSSLGSNDSQRITQYGNTFAVVTNAAWFLPGTNILLIANANNDGNGSGAGFYGLVNYQPLPVIQQPYRPAAGQFGFWVGGVTNEQYSIDASPNLLTPNWASLFSTNSDGTPFLFVDSYGTNKVRFYRVTVQP